MRPWDKLDEHILQEIHSFAANLQWQGKGSKEYEMGGLILDLLADYDSACKVLSSAICIENTEEE